MNKYIIVNLNLFALESPITIMDSNGGAVICGAYALEDIPEAIVALSREHGISDVKVICNPNFAEMVSTSIMNIEAAQYNENKIKVEVI